MGKDLGFGIRNLNSFVTLQSRRPPRRLFVVNCGQTTDYYLILNQPFQSLGTTVSQTLGVDSWSIVDSPNGLDQDELQLGV